MKILGSEDLKHFFVAAVFLVMASCLTGCMGVPGMQQQSGASMKAAEALAAKNALEIEQTIEGMTPPMPINVTGTNNIVKVNIDPNAFKKKTSVNSSTDQSSSSEIEQEWYQSSKLSWSVVGVLLLIIGFGVRAFLRSSATGRLIAKGADTFASTGIKALRRLSANSTARQDVEGARQLNEVIEQLQVDRGKMKVEANGHGQTF